MAAILYLLALPGISHAQSAVSVLGQDFVFPEKLEGVPQKLSDFEGLQIKSFTTSDHVELKYWEAGSGEPLIFAPAWSSNGAEYFYLISLLSKNYHVYVLDFRNQGLSQKVDYGNRISRYAADLKEFTEHLGINSAYYCGWSMGSAVLWSYIDLYGTKGIKKLVLIDEPISIYAHSDWTEQERRDTGAFVTDMENTIKAYVNIFSDTPSPSPLVEGLKDTRSPYFVNAMAFAKKFVKYLGQILFDHYTNDWRDVIRRIDVPTAIFTGEGSGWLPSQRWMHATIPGSELFVYTHAEHGDHFLAVKNPRKFADNLDVFLKK